ncbi:dimethylarginine dimethylaminohydrolase family protein [Yoonia sediminilitoris]|uniref:arginine deiminase n=1 Tax=Yoonia sediminilitoris TaxID=1286148 RepID=A0A2T6KQA3_9RHOB|nr:arginine deiminase family protein [Yoonia sediminilitoris]PUB18741.1 N-dimethylarginine dimethylaminohydrolase [Yoonia sediminilitoris]RCW98909.1 N-dimethylarginine dimethylaminohydrolase [Yoonia sediminilitoris]
MAESSFDSAAYGGQGWSPRTDDHAQEMGPLWQGGIDSEWRSLKSVLVRRPGPEIIVSDHDAAQQLAPLDLGRAQAEHDQMVAAYTNAGVTVLTVPDVPDPAPNRMFCADLFVMTPQGAILGRPASTVRAGEEIAVAQALAMANVPILRTLTGKAAFEGADLIWLDTRSALIGRGLRTNQAAISQINDLCLDLGIEVTAVDMPFGTMHLMGMLRIASRDLAIAWPRRTPHAAVTALRDRGYDVVFLPDEDEAQANRAMNFVTLSPGKILMPAGNDLISAWYQDLGIEVIETPTFELRKAAGAVGCLTGVVQRAMG